jgi:ribosome biogenesis GTPase A
MRACGPVAQVIVEVRDARLPLSCRHPAFDGWAAQGNRTTLLVYTHADLLSDDEVHLLRSSQPVLPPQSSLLAEQTTHFLSW